MKNKIIIAFLFFSPMAFSQTAKFQSICEKGNQPAVWSGQNSVTTVQATLTSCTVSVFLHNTSTLATLYSDSSNTPLSNPFTANSDGSFFFYANNALHYDVSATGTVVCQPFTGTCGAGGTQSFTISIADVMFAAGILAANNTWTGINTFINPGVFTNTQMNQYLLSLIGGIPSDMYRSLQGFSNYTTEAGTFGVAIPSNAGIGEGDGVVGMVTTNCNSAGRTKCNAVAVSGHAEALASGSAVWGINTTTSNHDNSLTGVNIIGAEHDVEASGDQSAGYVHGVDIFLTGVAGSTMPPGTNAAALEIGTTNSALDKWGEGIYIVGSGINPAGSAIYIDQNCSGGAGPCSSPPVTLAGMDSGNVVHPGSWSVDSSGSSIFSGGPLQATSGLKAGASGSTISDTRELLQSAHSCGTTATCANTSNQSNRMIFGTIPLSGGTATVSGISPAFTSTATMFCWASDITAANAVKALPASSSSVTFTGTGTDSVTYACIGN